MRHGSHDAGCNICKANGRDQAARPQPPVSVRRILHRIKRLRGPHLPEVGKACRRTRADPRDGRRRSPCSQPHLRRAFRLTNGRSGSTVDPETEAIRGNSG